MKLKNKNSNEKIVYLCGLEELTSKMFGIAKAIYRYNTFPSQFNITLQKYQKHG